MTWLDVPGSTRAEILSLRPELAADHQHLLDTLWQGVVRPVTLELCRLRMAMLLRCEPALAERSEPAVAAGLTEERIATLAAWPTDPSFTDEERACLAFTEQYLIDHHGVTDEQVAGLVEVLGPDGVVTLTTALTVWECQHRLDKALGVSGAGGA